MSVQRAIKSCRLCHEYAGKISETGVPLHVPGRNRSVTYYDFLIYLRDFATSQAMQAVEAAGCGGNINPNKDALDACQKCDYKEPRIANLLEDELIKTGKQSSMGGEA